METKEVLELSELQELALRHQHHSSSLEERRMIVQAHLVNHIPISQLSADFGVRKREIYRWIRTFAEGKVPRCYNRGPRVVKPNPLPMPKKQNVEESAAEELARLREENKRLAEALKMSEWMNHAKDVMIDKLAPNSNKACRREGQRPDHGPSLPAVWQELAGILSVQGHVRQATAKGRDGNPVR